MKQLPRNLLLEKPKKTSNCHVWSVLWPTQKLTSRSLQHHMITQSKRPRVGNKLLLRKLITLCSLISILLLSTLGSSIIYAWANYFIFLSSDFSYANEYNDIYIRNIMENNALCIINAQVTGDIIVAATTNIIDGMRFPLLRILRGVGKHQRQKLWPNLIQL